MVDSDRQDAARAEAWLSPHGRLVLRRERTLSSSLLEDRVCSVILCTCDWCSEIFVSMLDGWFSLG